MLRVEAKKPCSVVYSLLKHEYLGYLFEPYIVQLTPVGNLSLTSQKLHPQTTQEFSEHLDAVDLKLIKIMEEMSQDVIIKKLAKSTLKPALFFQKYNEEQHAIIRPVIENKIAECMELLKGKELYVMAKDGDPAGKKIEITQEPATVLFHFKKSSEGTRYFPTIKYKNERIEFMFKDAHIINASPAWMLLENQLISFTPGFDGKKLGPFLNKRFIDIPKASEPTYYKKFIIPLIEKYNVFAEGFEIITEKFEGKPSLKVVNTWNNKLNFVLSFSYGNYEFPYKSGSKVSVTMESQADSYIFHRVKRSLDWEAIKIKVLKDLGLIETEGSAFSLEEDTQASLNFLEKNEVYDSLDWLNRHIESLKAAGFTVKQDLEGKKYFIGKNKIEISINEGNDWFDVQAIISFGEFEIPFLELKNYILNGKREFMLPNGEIAVIPEEWFSKYRQLFSFAEGGKSLHLKKHHIGLIQSYVEGNLAEVTMTNKLNKLVQFNELDEIPMPKGFVGELRPYQMAGYNWFHFLKRFHFGGCLADDMGLGKTIQTLAFLQKQKEDNEETAKAIQLLGQGNLFDVTIHENKLTSLIIMPTSLIHNWLNEARKFTPELKIFVYTGIDRNKDTSMFAEYDLVLSTYGTIRIDIEEIQKFYFHYIILDESQAIKNPSSKIAKTVKLLKSKYKLVLTGTPIENSVLDLWSQMAFVNPGLLGGQTFFSDEYAIPIEKNKDEEKAKKLQALIKPFVLRRTKSQVATELPEKSENIYYSEMTADQAKIYEETKAYYRNMILEKMTTEGKANVQMHLLQGLTKLRQIANHPLLVDDSYEGESGKFTDIFINLENTIAKGHKILVFSQFVKHLSIFRKELDAKAIAYSYLDGSTKNREEVVEEFRGEESIKVFLISIKAGGVGLNLTEADYVYILDPWWNPAVERQAVDRTHRIGQSKNVFIYKFITKDSVEEKIVALQERKKVIADTLIKVEDSFIKSLSEEDIRSILS